MPNLKELNDREVTHDYIGEEPTKDNIRVIAALYGGAPREVVGRRDKIIKSVESEVDELTCIVTDDAVYVKPDGNGRNVWKKYEHETLPNNLSIV